MARQTLKSKCGLRCQRCQTMELYRQGVSVATYPGPNTLPLIHADPVAPVLIQLQIQGTAYFQFTAGGHKLSIVSVKPVT
jgi:hypothetical protein